MRTPSVREALSRGRVALSAGGVAGVDLDARLLLAHALGVEMSRLHAIDRSSLRLEQAETYAELIKSRAAGTPAAYLLGAREFWSIPFAVDRRVLVPRPETELLVECAAEFLEDGGRAADMGTGSGCVIVALAKEVEGDGWLAVDISDEALQVAEGNVRRHGLAGRITLRRSDLFSAVGERDGLFDVIVSNPPYIRSGEMDALQREVREHEPRQALDGGRDGLDVVRKVIAGAPAHLRAGGHLLLEVGDGQAEEVMACAAAEGGFKEISCRGDLAGTMRVVIAERKGTCRE
jgi:release factor glutamine methyltransferase